MASGQVKNPMPPEFQSIVHGTFKLVASCMAPIIFAKMSKRMIFIICGAFAAISMATGKIHIHTYPAKI